MKCSNFHRYQSTAGQSVREIMSQAWRLTSSSAPRRISYRNARPALGKPFTWPIDWLMQYLVMKEDYACYWRDPPFVDHGSQVGFFHSTTDEARMIDINRSQATPAGKHAFARRSLDRLKTTIRV